ncbi:ABC transporter ATP-binding protein [Campylobacter corcagiensis]|uniref:ABC transporter ATP-binding protein n=1 Tax=Campylobacter corcagiensis TaxID=1448857 RepID=A0A7M1LI55_9BACT|nr:ABC transporter ATP-binding protein [Campylobacter corcagiensis]QKF64254.1 ABC transporter, ATP-binding protein [Campylobacter corcagiensis]QOQ87556.1 ABC transporter ATP-binding protein [Campylobacter corcagiensis]
MTLLKGENLAKSFDYLLFENLNFEIKEGESSAVLGVSGCGKSTLLHILSSLLKPDFGEVIYNNKSLYKLKNDDLIKIRRHDFGIIFQAHYLFKGFNAFENVELGALLGGQKIDDEILKKLDIKDVIHQKVGDLSGGQQQRVSIARVLSKKPRIIFADEPTGNLDSTTANEVMEIFFDYIKENRAGLVLVTHDENLAKKCSNRFLLQDKKLNIL